MKKSEMVKALQNRFCTSDVDAIADLADEIIDFLVSQGMQPPAYEKMVSIEKLAPSKELWSNETFFEWEPE
jgi:hypothetical protein